MFLFDDIAYSFTFIFFLREQIISYNLKKRTPYFYIEDI